MATPQSQLQSLSGPIATPHRVKWDQVLSALRLSATVAILLIPEGASLPPAHRLLVLIPNLDVDEVELARRIWSLASPGGLEVLFLGMVRDDHEESRARRRLATLAAITRDNQTHVETQLQFGRHWLQVVRPVWKPGDLIVCHTEQTVLAWGLVRRSLDATLVSALNVPVYVLSGFYPETPSGQPNRIARLIYEAIPFAIMAGFFWIQVQIDQLARGWVNIALMCLSVLVELSLIGIWALYRTE